MSKYDTLEKILSYTVLCPEKGCRVWIGPTWGSPTVKYPVICYKGKATSGHRVVFQLCYNVVLTPAQLVLHSCDNGLCLEISHLSEGTHKKNAEDMVARGRCNPGISAALTEQDVRDIRELLSTRGALRYRIAEQYGVCRNTINNIANGKTWRHVA
jgi:hypothetical protein